MRTDIDLTTGYQHFFSNPKAVHVSHDEHGNLVITILGVEKTAYVFSAENASLILDTKITKKQLLNSYAQSF
jgi:hypothetical protein